MICKMLLKHLIYKQYSGKTYGIVIHTKTETDNLKKPVKIIHKQLILIFISNFILICTSLPGFTPDTKISLIVKKIRHYKYFTVTCTRWLTYTTSPFQNSIAAYNVHGLKSKYNIFIFQMHFEHLEHSASSKMSLGYNYTVK